MLSSILSFLKKIFSGNNIKINNAKNSPNAIVGDNNTINKISPKVEGETIIFEE